FALNNPSPRVVAANLLDRGKGEQFNGMVESWEIAAKPNRPKVGVVGLIGPSVIKQNTDATVKFASNNAAIVNNALADLKSREVDVTVLLYQGTAREAKECLKFCQKQQQVNARLAPIHVVVCLDDGEEPPGVPERVDNTYLIRLGHKSRYVGVVG